MLDSSATFPNCGWNETARAHIKAVVSLSGPTQFCDWSSPGIIPPQKLIDFENDLDNYVGLRPQTHCDPDCDWSGSCALDQASPAWLVSHGATSSPPPVMLYSTTGDPVPYSQSKDMQDALKNIQFPSLHVERWLMTYTYGDPHDHAYKVLARAKQRPHQRRPVRQPGSDHFLTGSLMNTSFSRLRFLVAAAVLFSAAQRPSFAGSATGRQTLRAEIGTPRRIGRPRRYQTRQRM